MPEMPYDPNEYWWREVFYPQAREILAHWLAIELEHEHAPECAPGCVNDHVAEGIQGVLAQDPQQVANLLCVAMRNWADVVRPATVEPGAAT